MQITRDRFGRNKETMFIPSRFAQIKLEACGLEARDVVDFVKTRVGGEDEVDVDDCFSWEAGDGGRAYVVDGEDGGLECVGVDLFGVVVMEGG